MKSPREQWTFGDKETEEKQNFFFLKRFLVNKPHYGTGTEIDKVQ
jgi:hypothetical protein